jgi:hypothetical protein
MFFSSFNVGMITLIDACEDNSPGSEKRAGSWGEIDNCLTTS